MLSILTMILPFVLKLGSWWLDVRGATKEEKLKYLSDFQAMQSQVDQAVRARVQALSVSNQMDDWEKSLAKPKEEPKP